MIVHLFFSYGKNYPFFCNWPPSTRHALGAAVMRGSSVIVATIHLGAGPKSRPQPLISKVRLFFNAPFRTETSPK